MIPVPFDNPNGEQLIQVSEDAGHRLWALTGAGELFVFERDSLSTQFEIGQFFSSGFATSLTCAADGRILIGSSENEIVILSGPETTEDGAISFSTGDITTINELHCMEDGRVLICGLTGFGYLETDGTVTRIDQMMTGQISANGAVMDREFLGCVLKLRSTPILSRVL